MAALTTNRNTLRQGFEALVPSYNYPIAAATKLFTGGMVALNAAGYLVAVTGVAAQNIVGVTDVATPAGLDNTGGANGALNAGVRRGIFLMNMGTAGDAVVQGTIGLPVYALDDNTVSPVSTAHTKVGIAMALEAGMVWVQIIGPT